MRQSFDRIQDSATLYGVAAANYELQLAYGPNLMAATRSDVGGAAGSGGQVLLGRRVPVEVIRNQTTVVTVDLSRDLGVIEGGVTLNGTAPGPGLALCVEARASTSTAERGEIFTWCMDLPATGQFRLLLPSGRGRGVICSSELVSNGRLVGSTTTAAGIAAGLLMQEFTFDVQAGKTTILPTIAFVTQRVEVRLQYKHEGWAVPAAPSATGAEDRIEGVLLSTRYTRQSFGRIQDSATLYGVAPASYELQLAVRPQPDGRVPERRGGCGWEWGASVVGPACARGSHKESDDGGHGGSVAGPGGH